MIDATLQTPPVFLRPAVDDAFLARGDFELRQEDFRAVVRVRPRKRKADPAFTLPIPQDDLPTGPHVVATPPDSDAFRIPEDFIPTEVIGVGNPVEVLPRAAWDDLPPQRVGTFEAFTRVDPRTLPDVEPAQELAEIRPRVRWMDWLGLPAVVASVVSLWIAMMMMIA